MNGSLEEPVPACVVGIDFGTDSVRSIAVDAASGTVLGASVKHYRDGRRATADPSPTGSGSTRSTTSKAWSSPCETRSRRRSHGAGPGAGIAVDTTGSTPALADRHGKPLALSAPFSENPNAMFLLWKDHTAVAEAERLNHLARTWGGVDYTKYVGGIYSSEWFWAKATHILETDPTVADAAVSIEHCDWILRCSPGRAISARFQRSRCAAGHKALWHAEFGGYPSDAFLAKLNSKLPALKKTLGSETFTSDTAFGTPLGRVGGKARPAARDGRRGGGVRRAHGRGGWRHRPPSDPQSDGDEHLRHLGVRARQRGREARLRNLRPGGWVGDPGMIGYEAGQSAFGDVYAWFKSLLSLAARDHSAGAARSPGRAEAGPGRPGHRPDHPRAGRERRGPHHRGDGALAARLDERPPDARRQPAAHRRDHPHPAGNRRAPHLPEPGRSHGVWLPRDSSSAFAPRESESTMPSPSAAWRRGAGSSCRRSPTS